MPQPAICVVGTGNHAKNNIYPALRAAGAHITGIAARHMENAAAAARQFAPTAGAYADYRQMLRQAPCDGVVVVAQPHDQYAIAMDCIGLGKPVFVEKPLGWTAAEAQAAADAAEQGGVPAMVGFMKRFAPAYQLLRRHTAEGALGAVRSFSAFFGADTAAFCTTAEDYLKTVGIHLLDLCLYLFGPVLRVQSMQQTHGRSISIAIALQMASGVLGSLHFEGADAWSREKELLTVTLEGGFVQVQDLARVTVHKNAPPPEADAPPADAYLAEADTVWTGTNAPGTGALRDLALRGFTGQLEHFLACLQAKRATGPTAAQNVHTMALIEQVMQGFVQA